MLKVQDLVARSANQRIDGLGFKVEPGEVLAVLGSSESGKHLLGQTIAGVHRLLGGELHINRYRLGTGSDKARIQLGYLPNPAPTAEFLTGYEFLDLVGSIYHLAPESRAERIQDLIDQLEIGPAVYSVAETAPPEVCQKVALAAAVIHSPKLVVLDEPTQFLDFTGKQLVQELVESIAKDSAGVVLITDNLELAEVVSDSFLVLENGRKLIEGSLSQLLNQTHPKMRNLRGVMETVSRQ